MFTSTPVSATGTDYRILPNEGQGSIRDTETSTKRSKTSDYTGSNAPKLPLRRDLFNDNWLWEILCTGLSVVCLIALVVLLKVFDQQPLPELRYGLTFNAIISILVTVSRTALGVVVANCISQLKWHWYLRERRTAGKSMLDIQLYDDASRGPWGSLVFLFTPHAWSWASIGAVVTIVVLTLDPFAQQLAQYPLRDFTLPSNADAPPPLIPRAETLFAGDNFYDSSQFLDTDLLSAMTSSVWTDSSPDSYVTDPVCAGDTCTWDEVESLAFCSACEDKTQVWHLDGCSLQFNLTQETWELLTGNASQLSNGTISYGAWNNCTIITTEHQSAQYSDIELSNTSNWMDKEMNIVHRFQQPINISMYSRIESSGGSGNQRKVRPSELRYANQTMWLVDGDYASTYVRRQAAGLETGAENRSALPILSMGSVHFQYDEAARSDGLSIKAASLCTLAPCVKKYQLRVQNGTVTTQVHDTQYGEFYYDPNATGKDHRINGNAGFTFANWKPMSNWSLERTGAHNLAHASAGPPNSSYHLDYNSTSAISSLFEDIFVGITMSIVHRDWPDVQNTTNITVLADFDPNNASQIMNVAAKWDDSKASITKGGYNTNAAMGQIVQGGGLEWVMPRVADSLSRFMRDRSGLSVPGRAFLSRQSVEVRWGWLVLPVVAVASGIVFLALTMYICRGPDYFLWKNSSLPLLYHNMERWDIIQDVQSSTHDVDRVGGMESMAKNTVTQLRRDEIDGELRFVRMKPASGQDDHE
ncbi:hypothetical protein G7054_g13667 [Neopestalotiopsis clavispora]|nr:hypothetical protein G7054_g13667 [Neopestalotiopsis clavispora]